MAQFIARIELYGRPSETEYALLHAAMGRQGFVRTITLNDGSEYHLPNAEYQLVGDMTIDQVWARANSAAVSVWANHGILCTQSAGIRVSGLRPVQTQAVSYGR